MIVCSTEILVQIKQGNKIAFKVLYDTYAPLIFDLGYKIMKDTAVAEEIVQDCFVKIWANRDQIRIEQDIWPWIYVSAKHLCYNQLRRAHVVQQYLIQVDDMIANDVEQKVEARELENHLILSIENLPEQQKKALRLSREEGYSHQQIAHEMGISPNTVKNHITQALKNLRKTLARADYNYLLLLAYTTASYLFRWITKQG